MVLRFNRLKCYKMRYIFKRVMQNVKRFIQLLNYYNVKICKSCKTRYSNCKKRLKKCVTTVTNALHEKALFYAGL